MMFFSKTSVLSCHIQNERKISCTSKIKRSSYFHKAVIIEKNLMNGPLMEYKLVRSFRDSFVLKWILLARLVFG